MRQRWNNPQIVKRWSDNSNNQASFWLSQTTAFQGEPTKMAAAQADRWLSNINQSKQLWIDRLNAIDGAAWRKRVTDAGTAQYSNGVTKKTTGYQNYVQKFKQIVPDLITALQANPRGTYAQNLARAKAVTDTLKRGFGKPF